ncbi:hypothetical protein [Streptomyces clavuligerus]|uniref:hypothetical protein n=1 Tax=Streptomyces clavuligerus TaxID=1901 RepID=UPI00017FF8F7|nr:hypothetical protein [Streptomyces clavuligerus]EDY48698.1 hypothetical protein SSCG_01726 [Streptomyces clavuligerus]WDN55813.1 hypothetical protein LL058_28380 [Streptomyces clavuligerus]
MASRNRTTAVQHKTIAALLSAAAELRPTPGYINGHSYEEWYIEATPGLLRALAALAREQAAGEHAIVLDRLSGPLCMEPLDSELDHEKYPKRWCFSPVDQPGEPCPAHTQQHAANLGRCTHAESFPSAQTYRICREPLVPGTDRCERHTGLCRAVKLDGTVCGRPGCRVPKHQNT